MSIKTWKVKEDSTTGIQIGEAFIQIVVSAGSEGSPGSNRDVAPRTRILMEHYGDHRVDGDKCFQARLHIQIRI